MPSERNDALLFSAARIAKPRREDGRFLRGEGAYSDDINLAGQVYAAMVRAPHAHARLRSVDVSTAKGAPGVVSVLTGDDYRADGLRDLGHGANPAGAVEWQNPAFLNRDGSIPFDRPQPPIVNDRVRHIGEIVAVVVADTAAGARDAADLVMVEYETLPLVTDALAALATGAPSIWEDCPGNVALDAEQGDEAAVERAFDRATHVVKAQFYVNRVINCQMEPRAAIGEWHRDTAKLTLHAGGQGVHRHKSILAVMFALDPGNVRVVSKDVGGGFGPRNMLYPEFALVCWAAKKTGCSVKWSGDRSEAFVTDYQARDIY
ncbi:MAG: molybdopterin cofactor-binding domain-containing protein [Pseudomonadota bacterium]|nr:molybdopterin cofactor-binding domain-containing protein [Pseudomonadota bacterium]